MLWAHGNASAITMRLIKTRYYDRQQEQTGDSGLNQHRTQRNQYYALDRFWPRCPPLVQVSNVPSMQLQLAGRLKT